METLGQDPYLNGIAFGLAVSAYVDAGVIAGGKVTNSLFNMCLSGSLTCDSTFFSMNRKPIALKESSPQPLRVSTPATQMIRLFTKHIYGRSMMPSRLAWEQLCAP